MRRTHTIVNTLVRVGHDFKKQYFDRQQNFFIKDSRKKAVSEEEKEGKEKDVNKI